MMNDLTPRRGRFRRFVLEKLRSSKNSRRNRMAGLAVLGALVIMPSVAQIKPVTKPSHADHKAAHNSANYVGSETCAACHANIYQSFLKTDMGRSITPVDDNAFIASLPTPVTIYDRDAGQYFEVLRKDGHLYQSQYALDANGKEKFRQTWKLEYVVGAGENGYGFIIQREHYLFEAPLCYYKATHSWDFSPGYEFHNYGFTRPILPECISCHSGVPRPVAGGTGLYKSPPFKEMAVGCETCHGPGSLHVDRYTGKLGLDVGSENHDIVNPARLSGWLADNICMRCHQGEDVRVYKPGAQDADFRPGMPLNSVLSIFKAVPGSQSRPASAHLEYYYGMTTSKCFRATRGELHCITCHDPHKQLAGTEAIEYYRSRCMKCHNDQSCTLSREKRNATNPPDNCISCHMPKRALTSIMHAALTDHSIPVSLQKADAIDDGSMSGARLLRLTEPLGQRENLESVPPIMLMHVYDVLVSKGHKEFIPKRDRILDQLALSQPTNDIVLRALAERAARKDTPQSRKQATGYMDRVVHSGSSGVKDGLFLAELYGRQNLNQDAINILEKVRVSDPYIPNVYELLATNYMAVGDYRNALFMLKKGLELFPGDHKLHLLDRKVKAATIGGAVSP